MSRPAPGSPGKPDDSLLLADFPASAAAWPWQVVDDGVMGGRSEGHLRLEDRWLVFSGTTSTLGGGFSSIRSPSRRLELGTYTGVRLRVRGDGRVYTFRLTTVETRHDGRRPSYWADFETRGDQWEEVDVPFTRFRPRFRGHWLEGPALDPDAIDSLGLVIYDGRDGPFQLDLDWIRAYRRP